MKRFKKISRGTIRAIAALAFVVLVFSLALAIIAGMSEGTMGP